MRKYLKLLMTTIIFLIVSAWAIAQNEFAYDMFVDANYVFYDNVHVENVHLDTDPPTVLSTFPVDGAVDVVTNITVQIAFSEEMDTSSVVVTGLPILAVLWLESNTKIVLGIPILELNTEYTLVVNGKDVVGNTMTEYLFSFTTEQESVPPTVISTTPVDGSTAVSINETVSITFSEAMNEDSVIVTGLPNPIYTWNGNTLTVEHDQFDYATAYNVVVNGQDLAGNSLSETSFLFVTEQEPDFTPPSIVSTTPADGATSIGLNAVVSIVFDEIMNEDSVIVAGLPNPIYTWNGNTLTVGHDQFDYDSIYTVVVNGQDTSGNSMTEYLFSFTTQADTDPPMVVSTTPVDGATNVGLNAVVSITFSEAMNEDSVIVTGLPNPIYTWNGNTLTVEHDQFDYDSIYQVRVNGQDTAGNSMIEYIFSFTVKRDNDPPTVVSTTPIDGAVDVPIDVVVSVVFNESMDTSLTSVTGLSGITYVWDANTVFVHYTGYLSYNVTYTLSINGRDTAGNTMHETYFFTTEEGPDHQKPFIVSTSPVDGATDVTLDATVSVIFSEMMNNSSVTVTGLPITSYEWLDSILTINHQLLNYNTTYNIVVNGKDVVGNSMIEESFMFMTVDCDNPYMIELDTIGCDVVTIEGIDYITNQDVEHTYLASNGCDSLVTYHVVINSIPNMPSTIEDDNNDQIVGEGEIITYQVDVSSDPTAMVVWNVTGNNQFEIDNNTVTVTWNNPGTISVAYINECGTSDSLTVVVDEVIGFEDKLGLQSVSVYPNPATESEYVQIQSQRNIQSIVFYNMFGNVVSIHTNVSSQYRIPVSSYQSGMYLIQVVFDKGEQQIIKFFK